MDVVHNEKLKGFLALFGITQLFGIILVVLVTYWSIAYRGGFAFRNNIDLEFNWHPFLMIIGMVYLQGSSILVYRGFRNAHKKSLKIAHATIHAVALIFVLCAAIAVFDNHFQSSPLKPNLYSLHSWVGGIASFLYIIQWIGSFVIYLYPGLPTSVRTMAMSYHIFFGLVIFTLGSAAAIVGINEKAIYTFSSAYGDKGSEPTLMNIMGLVIVIFNILVVYITTNANFKRFPRPEDRELLGGRTSE